MSVRNEPDARTEPTANGRAARPGREALLERAADLLAGADLERVVGATVGVRDVALAAGVAPATVNHHFPAGGSRRNRRLSEAAIRHALLRRGNPISRATAEAALATADLLRDGDPDALRTLAVIAATDLLSYSPEDGNDVSLEAEIVSVLLAAAIAPRSPESADALRTMYRNLRDIQVAMIDGLLEATGRRFVGRFDAASFAGVITALADGFMIRRRFAPGQMTPDLFGDVIIRLFEAFTAFRSDPVETDPADRLLPPPTGSTVDPHKRAIIVETARAVYDREGWEGLTLANVATAASVSRATVVANFRDRGGLAAAVWARHVPALQAGLNEDVADGRAVHVVVRRHLGRMSEVARTNHRLTGGLLEAVFAYSIEHGAPRPGDPADPRPLVPLPTILADALPPFADLFRTGYADSPTAIYDTAALLSNQALHLCMTRPLLTAAEVAHRICDTTLAGMLRRRPPTS